jgi:type IX secretion system PorP/SprF family membrane protein
MKKVLTLLIMVFSISAMAQQDPYYTHFKDVSQAYNPAGAGEHHGKICLSGLAHYQWRDYSDQTLERGTNGSVGPIVENVAPVTYNLNVGTVFNLGKSRKNAIGFGLTAIQDQLGFTKTTNIMANINFKHYLQGNADNHFGEIAGGIGIGGNQFGFVNPQFRYRDPNDPNIPVTGGSQMLMDLNFGIMYKQKRLGSLDNFYAGLSATHLNGAFYDIITTSGNITRQYEPHYYALVGADYDAGVVTLEPAILAKYAFIASEYRPQFDVNMTALYQNTFRGGLAYRQYGNADAISVLLGYVVKDNLTIGYSYDITVSSIQSVSNGTHEIMVKYCIPIGTIDSDPPVLKLTPRFL